MNDFKSLNHFKGSDAPLPSYSHSNGIPHPYSNDHHRSKAPKEELKSPPKKSKLLTTGVGKEGKIMSRTSVPALFFRRWQETYWLHVHPTIIHLFDSQEDLDQWKEWYTRDEERQQQAQNNPGEQSTLMPTIIDEEAREAKKLIKWSLNFDSEQLVQRRAEKAEKKRCKYYGINPPPSKVTHDGIYRPPLVYVLEDVRSKHYEGATGPVIHNCKISYLSRSGRNIAASFGSFEQAELKKIRATIRYIIRTVNKQINRKSGHKKGSSKKKGRHVGDNNHPEDTDDIESSIYGDQSTLVSAAGRYSAVASEMSTTQYGPATMTKKSLRFISADSKKK